MTDCILKIGNDASKNLSINFRTNKVYNAGLIASAEYGINKAECYFCGYIDGQVRIDVKENNIVKSILLPGTISIIEMANCVIEITIKVTGQDYIIINGRIVSIDIYSNSLLEINGGKNYEG